MSTLELGIIGNGTVAALIDPNASVQWMCLPRLDGEPIFNSLLGGNGHFSIALSDQVSATQTDIKNTAVLETVLTDADGSSIKIPDLNGRPRYLVDDNSQRIGELF